MRLSLATTATALVLLSVAACGGDTTSTTPETDTEVAVTTLSKADFITQGDAICAQLVADTVAVTPPADEADFGRFVGDVLALATATSTSFSALAAPEDGQALQTELVSALDTATATAEGAITAAEAGDSVTAGDLLAQSSVEGKVADEAARDYGFTECGKV